MNIEIEMSGFDAVLNEAMKIVAPETLEAANQESGEYLRDYLASWYDNKGREHWVNNSLPTHGPGRMSTAGFPTLPANGSFLLRTLPERSSPTLTRTAPCGTKSGAGQSQPKTLER